MDATAELLGQAPSIAALREQIRRIVERTSHGPRLPPILLQGETGTGKSLVAHVIHRAGARSRGPFVDVNCAAIPEGLLEAELFGFERGAFTDARQPKVGLFQSAHGGTIFLDELSLLPDALQAKLLKVIEERAVRRLGGTRPEPVDVSIIAAANEDLRAAVGDRRFRQDLYHRLAVVTVCLPPLRERADDIPILAEHFLGCACKDYGLPEKRLTTAAQATLCAYRWPGNVRELANVMERAALLTDTPRVGPEMLQLPTETAVLDSHADVAARGASLGARIEAMERGELLSALEETRWNVARAALRLGITRGTIRYRIAKYDLAPRSRRPRRSPPAPPTAPPVALPPVTTTRWEPRLVALLAAIVRPVDEADATAEFGWGFDIVVQKIESFAGRIEDVTPARILAAFGVDPSEDAPRCAALAAMAIQNAMSRAWQSLPRSARMTIAIHAEHCPVAEVGGRLQIDGDARRRATTVLEELRAHAGPDTVVVSETARSLLGRRFDFTEPPGGEVAPTSGRRLLGYQQRRFGVGGLPGAFVGRDHELGMLRTRWQGALQGRGQLVALVGEPGIGKSRLLFEFHQALGDESLTYLEGRCESYGGGIPYLPVIEFLKGHFGIGERDDPSATSAKVTAQLHALDKALASDASPFLALLGAPGVDPTWRALEPVQRRQRTLDALTRFVLCLSQPQPALLAIEDLHWIDTETQAFLDRLVVSLPAARLLVLVSYRPEYGHTWGSKSCYTQLRLDSLAPATAEDLARSLVGADVALRPLTRLLVEQAKAIRSSWRRASTPSSRHADWSVNVVPTDPVRNFTP
jgi:two-component system, NtrC family, response regulator AtoC